MTVSQVAAIPTGSRRRYRQDNKGKGKEKKKREKRGSGMAELQVVVRPESCPTPGKAII
jgi:hypothetical protein